MKILFLIGFLLISSTCYADSYNLKLGFADYMVEGLDASPRIEVSYEFNPKLTVPIKLGIEYGVGFTSSNAHDTQVETPFVGKSMGRLNLLDYFLTLKWYFTKDMHIGGGIDYLDPYFKETYSAQADWDDEIGAHAQIGWEFKKGWTLINKWGWGDIDAESGLEPVTAYGYTFTNGILESQSNQTYWAILIERKF